MQGLNYTCPKYQNTQYEVDSFYAAKGFFEYFNPKHFTTITCSNCHYTEIYKASPDMLKSIFDSIFGRQE